MKAHVWRYDTPTAPDTHPNPAVDSRADWPWIASFEGTREPIDFQTWDEAYRYACTVMGQSPPTGPCPCECNRGGFCGGCGHAGCGGRRR